MDEKKLEKLKEKIRDEKLLEIYGKIGKLICLGIIGAVIGYLYFRDNQYNPILGILLGIACPWGYIAIDYLSKALYTVLEDLYKLVTLITFGIYAIAWFVLKIVMSAYVGLAVAPILATYYVIKIKKAWKEDYTEEARSRYFFEYPDESKRIIKELENYQPQTTNQVSTSGVEDAYYCEMCFKKISQQEYELHECLCEDCYMDMHTDENGNFREDYYKY